MKGLLLALLFAFGYLSARSQSAASPAAAQPTQLHISPYVGLGALYGQYQLNHSNVKMNNPVPLLVLGLQVGRVGVQFGGAYYQPGPVVNRSTYQDYSTNPASTRYFTNSSEARSYLFPLAVRYGLLAPGHKLQLEPCLGVLLAYSRSSNFSTTTDAAGTVLSHLEGGSNTSDSGLLAGLGLRYNLLARLALMADGWISFYRQGYFPAVLPTATAGVRYQFGRAGQ